MWLTLPITNAKCTENIEHFVANFYLSAVADKFCGSATCPDVIFKGIDKLFIRPNTMNVSDVRFKTSKDNSGSRAVVNRRYVGVNNVTCDGFVTAGDVKCRIGGLEGALQQCTRWETGILSGVLKSLFDDVRAEPAKERAKHDVIGRLVCDCPRI